MTEITPELTTADKLHLQDVAERTLTDRPGRGPRAAEVREMRDKLSVGKWQEVIEGLNGNAKTTAAEMRHLVDHTFGVTRNPANGEKTHPGGTTPGTEGKRHTDAQNALKTVLPILESADYDQIKDPAEKNAVRDTVIAALENSHQFPDFNTRSHAEKRHAAEELLRNPRLKKVLVEKVLKPISQMPMITDKDLHEAAKKSGVSMAESQFANDKSTITADHLGRLEDKLRGIITNTPILEPRALAMLNDLAPLRARLGLLEQQAISLRSDIDTMRPVTVQDRNVQIVQGRGTQYSRDRGRTHVVDPGDDLRSQNLQRALDGIVQQQTQIQQQIESVSRSYSDLIPLEEQVWNERSAGLDRYGEADKKRVESAMDAVGNRNEYEDLKRQRALQEQAIVTMLENALPQALEEFVAEELQSIHVKLSKELLEKKQENLEAAQKACLRNIETRWKQRVTRKEGLFKRRVERSLINRNKTSQEFKILEDQGLDAYMQHAFATLPEVATLDPKDRDKLLEDETLQKALITPLIANYTRLEGLHPSQVEQLMSMRVVSDQIDAAMSHNETYRSRVEGLVGTAVDPQDESFKAEFSRVAARHPGLLLFPITGIPLALFDLAVTAWKRRPSNSRQRTAYHLAA